MTLPDLKPMKMTDIPVTDVDDYFDDPEWIMEQKNDGARALVSWSEGTGQFRWQASGGGPLKFAAALLHLENLENDLLTMIDAFGIHEIILDGELMPEEGTLRVFDVPHLLSNGISIPVPAPSDKLSHRIAVREELFRGPRFQYVRQVYTARTAEEKRELWSKINEQGVEGGMVKHLSSPYESGIRTKMQRKLKLVKTADVIVTSVERRFDHKGMVTHGSADLAVTIAPEDDPRPFASQVTGKRLTREELTLLQVGTKAQQARALAHIYDPRDQLPVGAASLIGKDLTIDVDSVVEINYLYWTGDAVIQPRIMRKRLAEEKLPEDCRLDQFPAYSKAEVS